MICSNCGAELPDFDAQYCRSCGQYVVKNNGYNANVSFASAPTYESAGQNNNNAGYAPNGPSKGTNNDPAVAYYAKLLREASGKSGSVWTVPIRILSGLMIFGGLIGGAALGSFFEGKLALLFAFLGLLLGFLAASGGMMLSTAVDSLVACKRYERIMSNIMLQIMEDLRKK